MSNDGYLSTHDQVVDYIKKAFTPEVQLAIAATLIMDSKYKAGLPVVVNYCYGGFGLSDQALALLKLPEDQYGCVIHPHRHHPDLVKVVRELGAGASGMCSKLAIKEVYPNQPYSILDHDGFESV